MLTCLKPPVVIVAVWSLFMGVWFARDLMVVVDGDGGRVVASWGYQCHVVYVIVSKI